MQATPDWLDHVRQRVEARLVAVLDNATSEARARASRAEPVVTAVRDLTLRGGKRLRATLVRAAAEATGPTNGLDAALDDAGAAVELLQSYLLIHDDWMDGDRVRRGGPTAHVALGERVGDARLGGSLAILAGDYASALAQELAASASIAIDRTAVVARAFARMQRQVVLGQSLDLLDADDLDALHDLKTTSYTVRGPVAIGAAIAGAPESTQHSLDAFSTPCGLAFQLRDDLLGVFGDEARTGKPAGSDLRRGKRTAPVRHALRVLPDADRARLESYLGREDAVAEAVALLRASGAEAAIEARIAALRTQALEAISSLRAEGRAHLEQLTWAMTERRQ